MFSIIYKHKELDNLEWNTREIERLVQCGERLNLKAYVKQVRIFGVTVYTFKG